MWALFLLRALLPLVVSGFFNRKPEVCQNETIAFGEKKLSWTMPKGIFYKEQNCSYQFTYPRDSVLRMRFQESGSHCTVTVIDSLNYTQTFECVYLETYTFPPPRVTFHFEFTEKFTGLPDSSETRFFVRKFYPYNYTDYLSISPGSEPLLIKPSSLKDQRTYIFDGFPMLNAYYLERNVHFKRNIHAKAESLLMLDGNRSYLNITGTVASWEGRQTASQLIIFNALYNADEDFDPMLIFFHADDLIDYQNPQFVLESDKGTLIKMDASEGKTSLTVPVFEGPKCAFFNLYNFTTSDDIEMLLVNGFPKANLSEDAIIERYTASSLNENTVLILGCTKTLILLNGSVSATLSNQRDIMLGHQLTGILRSESATDEVFRSFADVDPAQLFDFEFYWAENYSPKAKLRIFGNQQNWTDYSPRSPVRLTATWVWVKLEGMATVSYTITRNNTPVATTATPVGEDDQEPSISLDALPVCLQFRFMQCIQLKYWQKYD